MQSVGDFTDICLLHDHSNAYCTCLLCFRNWNTTILVLGAVQGLTYLLVGLEIQDLEPPMFSIVQVHLKRCAILTSQELNNCSKL
ncbi:hypothetical protein QL285_001440 [Trifolium repens]|nr:hypothetical protein QL285_001440 [Trifolium repens]